MNLHEHLSHWESFYMLVGTAGATLAGLTFVAVASAERLMREGNKMTPLRSHIDPSLLAFTLALLLGCLMLMPTLSSLALGLSVMVCGVYFGGYSAFILRQITLVTMRRHYDLLDWFFFVVLPLATSLLLVVAGGLCLAGATEVALTLIGVVLLTLLLMGIRNALDMLMNTLNYAAKSAQVSEKAAK